MEVIIGTYEQYLLGYKIVQDADSKKWKLVPSFTNHAHAGSIRAVTASAQWIASGGSDEVVRIFSMKKRADVGSLMQQEGTISCLEFYQETHVFSGSDDGTVCIFDTRNWDCLKTLRGHKSAVNSISVHPSGKMLLSVSKDKTLRTWNLIKGRCAYITNLKTVADLVLWVPSGQQFLVVVGSQIDVYNIAVGGVISSMDFGSRISSITFINETVIAVAGDSESIHFYQVLDGKQIMRFKSHENRVKGLFCNFSPKKSLSNVWLFSVSSDSHINVWDVTNLQPPSNPALVASVDTTCRPTCMTVVIPNQEPSEASSSLSRTSIPEQKENRVSSQKRKSRSSVVEAPASGVGKKIKKGNVTT